MTSPIQDATVGHVTDIAQRAQLASRQLSSSTIAIRNRALERIAHALDTARDEIIDANTRDLSETARIGQVAPSLLQRLTLSADKLAMMTASVRAVLALPDPVRRELMRTSIGDGITLRKVTVPIGVVAAIFEARPDAVTQIVSLAIKSGNAVVLKAGQEVLHTARVLVRCIRAAIAATGDISADAVGMIEGRSSVDVLLTLEDKIDLVIPRGSGAFVKWIQTHTHIPILGHSEGVCHVYIDQAADIGMAINIVVDGKVQYPAACNATEAVLVHRGIAPEVLPLLINTLHANSVEVRGCTHTRSIVSSLVICTATEQDWGLEYGALTIACRVVESLDMALEHIARYGSRHTDTIVTNNTETAMRFQRDVDAAGVYHNVSTRFADGFRYGLGAEVGISTSKIHARGPVGLEGLTTYKYLLDGSGQLVKDYVHAPVGGAILGRKIQL